MQWKKRKIHPLVCRFGSPVWQSLFYYWYSGKKYVEVRKNSSVLSERAKGGMHMCNKKELSFSIFMIYSLADKWKMSPAKVYKILNSTGILDDYIIKC